MILFRNADSRGPFLWEGATQPPARWHGEGEGPVHYLADTPAGAWAEFLRHEEIADAADLQGIARAIWAVEVPEEELAEPKLPRRVLTGGRGTYERCRKEARRLRAVGASGLRTPSAALGRGAASGWIVDAGVRQGPKRDGFVYACFGRRADFVGWAAAIDGRPEPELLGRVHHYED